MIIPFCLLCSRNPSKMEIRKWCGGCVCWLNESYGKHFISISFVHTFASCLMWWWHTEERRVWHNFSRVMAFTFYLTGVLLIALENPAGRAGEFGHCGILSLSSRWMKMFMQIFSLSLSTEIFQREMRTFTMVWVGDGGKASSTGLISDNGNFPCISARMSLLIPNYNGSFLSFSLECEF